MPIFEFKCDKCQEQFEELVKSSSEKAPPCPECGARKTRRLMSTFAWSGGGTGGKKMAGGSSCSSCHSSGSACKSCSH